MAFHHRCDLCKKEIHINPHHEFETEEVTIEPPEVLKGKVPAVRQSVPKTTTFRRQNPLTGKMEDVKVPVVRDLQERCHTVRLTIGHHEHVSADLCTKCLEHVKPQLKALWAALEETKG